MEQKSEGGSSKGLSGRSNEDKIKNARLTNEPGQNKVSAWVVFRITTHMFRPTHLSIPERAAGDENDLRECHSNPACL
jgi:hypothetical protein